MIARPDPILSRKFEVEDRQFEAALEARRDKHKLEMAKLELAVGPRRELFKLILKGPALGLCIVAIFILQLAGKSIPKALNDFLAT